MNAPFVGIGVLTIVGALLLRPVWPAGRLATAGVVLWVVAGLGKIVVGLVPEHADAGLHQLGAFNIPMGSIAILLPSIAVRRTAPSLAGVGVALAGPGLLGTVLSAAGQLSPGLVPRVGRRRLGTAGWLPRQPLDAGHRRAGGEHTAPTNSRSRNAPSSAVKATGLSWLLACPASGIVT
jgi:hypothetical protein